MSEDFDAWVRLAWPNELRSMRAALAGQIAAHLTTPEPDETDRLTAPMRWLLEKCAGGVTLTQSGYLAPVLVGQAVERFGWWPFGGSPRSEADVHQLEMLRTTARRMRLTFRRGRRATWPLGDREVPRGQETRRPAGLRATIST